MKYKQIYDKKFIEKLPEFDKYDNPWVVSLCKRKESSLKRLRLQIERWFQNLPDKNKPEMYNALRSLGNAEFLAAFYELMIFQYCIEEGWEIKKHPLINGKTPDFEIKTAKEKFYMEVLTIFEEKEKAKQKRKYHNLLREIGMIKSDYLISVYIKEWLDSNSDFKKIVGEIKIWLHGLDKQEGINYKKKINKFGFNGSISARYYKNINPDKDCISGWNYPVHSGPSLERIKSKIRKKVKNYNFLKKTSTPFVIAVCADEDFFWESAIDWSLYGKLTISWEINNPKAESKVGRDNSGLITPNPGLLGEPKNKVISAIMFCAQNWSKEKITFLMKVFHNPCSIANLPIKIFEKMPQFTVVKKTKQHMVLKWINDKNQRIVFN